MPESLLEYPLGGEVDNLDENNIKKLLRSWLSGVQTVEVALEQLLTLRAIDTAEGAQLDVLGKVVGQGRGGLVDDDYRRYIRARVRANRSHGTVRDVLAVANLVINDDDAYVEIEQQGNAAYVLKVDDIPFSFSNSLILLQMVTRATSAGVRVIVETNADTPENSFNLLDGPGKGFGQLPQLDLGPLTANIETVVRHRDSRIPTLALVADGAGAGSLTNTGDAWTFHFQSGVTTVAQFETAINASSALVVLTTDGVGTLAAGDVLAATPFTKTVTGGKLSSAFSS
jgi:hypothetical protein